MKEHYALAKLRSPAKGFTFGELRLKPHQIQRGKGYSLRDYQRFAKIKMRKHQIRKYFPTVWSKHEPKNCQKPPPKFKQSWREICFSLQCTPTRKI